MNDAVRPTSASRGTWLAGPIGLYGDAIRLIEKLYGPIADLLTRLALAQAFFVSGILKLADWQTALALARYEYPVSWMDPVTAAYVGVTIEILCPILLAVGLATRLAAAPLLMLSLVIQLNYTVLDTNLFWAVLAGWFVVRGAGPLSLDRLLARGLGDTALPLASGAIRAARWVTDHVKPMYQLGMRAWIATGLVLAAALLTGSMGETSPENLGLWLPLDTLAPLANGVGLSAAALLLVGLATRVAALALIGLVLGTAMMDTAQMAFAPWLIMVLAPTALYGAGRYSLDRVIDHRLRRAFPQLDGKPAFSLEGLPSVVIVGAGFGGWPALRRCDARRWRSPWWIATIITCFNHCSIRSRRPALRPATSQARPAVCSASSSTHGCYSAR